MKKFCGAALAALGFFSVPALATVDAHTSVYLVVGNIQGEGFFVERAPVIGCYGVEYGPQLDRLTAEYYVADNIGCGGQPVMTNINYLTCARVLGYVENEETTALKELELDISRCDAKNDLDFLAVLHKAIKLNFPQRNPKEEIRLILRS